MKFLPAMAVLLLFWASPLLSQGLESQICAGSARSVALLVDPQLKDGIRSSLDQFESDLCADSYGVFEVQANFADPPQVRAYLADLYARTQRRLIGVLLIGRIPYAYQRVTLVYSNPNLQPFVEDVISFQYYADLDGTFSASPVYASQAPRPHSFDIHTGNLNWEIWVSSLPYYKGEVPRTVDAINRYFSRNHAYRSTGSRLPRAYMEINEHYKATTQTEYQSFVQLMRSGQYAWTPFSNSSSARLYFDSAATGLSVDDGYADLQAGAADFTSLAAHGFWGASGKLTIASVESGRVRTHFLWSDGCAVGNLDRPDNFLSSAVYSPTSMVLVAKGTTNDSGGLGTNSNGFYGRNIATGLTQGLSFGEALLGHVNVPLIAPWASSREFHFATILIMGDPTLRYPSRDDSTQTLSLVARGLTSLETIPGPAAQIAYGRIEPQTGNPAALSIFSYRNGGVLISETTVPATPALRAARLHARLGGPINTGVAIANPNNRDVTVSYEFKDESGTAIKSGNLAVPAYGQLARFINEAPFDIRGEFSGTLTLNNSAAVGVLAIRGVTNERGDFLLSTVPVVSLPSFLSGPAIIPHVAYGGGWSTIIVLVNPTDQQLTGTLEVVGSLSPSLPYQVAAGSSRTFEWTSTNPLVTGSVQIVPASGPAPAGLAIFEFRSGSVTVTQAVVPAVQASNAFVMYVEGDGNLQSAVALANPSNSSVSVTFELTRPDGSSMGLNGNVAIPARGQVALFLNQVHGFESLATRYIGVLRMSAANVFAPLGLRTRYNERNEFLTTTTSPVEETSGVTGSPLFLPHVVNGGGYTTQTIIFTANPGTGLTGTLRFFGQDGLTMRVPMIAR